MSAKATEAHSSEDEATFEDCEEVELDILKRLLTKLQVTLGTKIPLKTVWSRNTRLRNDGGNFEQEKRRYRLNCWVKKGSGMSSFNKSHLKLQ